VPSFGIDVLDLTLAANLGEPARPLRKVASGGELSRTMLALKTVMAGHDRLGTLVFDEIDANIGGRMGPGGPDGGGAGWARLRSQAKQRLSLAGA
jgi:DNA repair protein RecN (Recombination protein N)